jgi:hypothetical protein
MGKLVNIIMLISAWKTGTSLRYQLNLSCFFMMVALQTNWCIESSQGIVLHLFFLIACFLNSFLENRFLTYESLLGLYLLTLRIQ